MMPVDERADRLNKTWVSNMVTNICVASASGLLRFSEISTERKLTQETSCGDPQHQEDFQGWASTVPPFASALLRINCYVPSIGCSQAQSAHSTILLSLTTRCNRKSALQFPCETWTCIMECSRAQYSATWSAVTLSLPATLQHSENLDKDRGQFEQNRPVCQP